MELTVYADVLFATNFLMDLVILFLTVQLSRIDWRLGRLTIASALLALYGTVSFLPEVGVIPSFLGRGIVGMVAVWILKPNGGWLGFLKARIMLGLVSVGVGGVVYGLAVGTQLGRNLRGISVNGTVYFLLDMRLLLAGIFLSFGLLLWFRRSCIRNFSRDKILIPMKIMVGEENITLTALADTGCELTAPVSGEGVLLISEKLIEGVTPKESFWLSIHTASGEDRIPAFYPEEITCLSQRYELAERPLIGIVRENFSRDGLYSGVFNPQIISEIKQSGGRKYEDETTEVFTVLTKNLTQMVKSPAKGCVLYWRKRKSSGTTWKGRGRKSPCTIGSAGGTGTGAENLNRKEPAIGCLHSTEV